MVEDKPLVSVVMPVHNGKKYVEESIRSCLDQTYQNVEIVVVDDKSTDGTLEIVQKLEKENPKLKVIPVEKQNGLGDVINIGIKAAKGKYIARLDADDVMYPTRLEKQVDFLEANSEVVALGGQIDIIDAIGKITGQWEYILDDEGIKNNQFIYQPFAHPAVTMRKSAIEKVGYYPEGIWKVEDVKFFFILSQVGKFANLPDKVIKYRLTFDTQSQSDLVGHFKKTEEVRRWAIKELGIKPDFRQRVLWIAEKIGVSILSLLPPTLYLKCFHLFRKVTR